MNACAMAEQPGRQYTRVVEDQQLVSTKELWQVDESAILPTTTRTTHHEKARSFALR
jgi:hypothetical protein